MPEAGDTAVDKGTGLRAGDLVAGRYRIEKILGSGGMGIVVAAIDESTGDAVAVKLLRSIEDTRAVERFFREARAMGKLDSEHVVRVRDSGSAPGQKPYLVMDRLEGVDLSQRAKDHGPLSVREAADHVLQACEALSHAHAKGIVHRDVKPSNLFLHEEGGRTILKVLDFGISKVRGGEVWERTLTTTDNGGVLGSPPYMSPEQVRDPKAVDTRTDVWSLGVVLYKLLSGVVPYDGESVGEVFSKVLERPYPPLRTTTDVPAEIDAIVERCLAKDRHERWANVGELAGALAPYASPEQAALAPRIAHRMQEEGPTLERPSTIPELAPVEMARERSGEPRTLTVSQPPPAAVPGGSRSTSTSRSRSTSTSTSTSTSGRNLVVLGALVIAVAAGIGIGLGVRGTGSAAAPGASASAPVASESAPSASSAAATTAAPPASASATAAAATSTGKRTRGRRPAASAAGRPELQPSPYPTAP